MLCGKIQLTLEIAQLDSNAKNHAKKQCASESAPKAWVPGLSDILGEIVLDGRITAGSLKQHPCIKSTNTAAIHGIALVHTVHTKKNRAKPYQERLILWQDE